MEAKNRDIKYMHTNTEVIQYNGHPYCEVIFFDFHLTTDTMSSNYIYTRMKGKIFFALLVSIIISAGLWAATGAFPLKGVFWSQGWWWSSPSWWHPWKVIFDPPATPQILPDSTLAGSFWLGNVGWVSFDHGISAETARINCTDVFNDATALCPVTWSAWSQNAWWVILDAAKIGIGSGAYYNPNTTALEWWGWSRALGWVPMWTGLTGSTLPAPTDIADPLGGAPVNFISKIAIVGNIAGSRVFSVQNNATTNQDVGYSYKTINHADILNLIRKNVALISRNISDSDLANENNTLDFFIKKTDYTPGSGDLPNRKRSAIVIGADIILTQAYINSTIWDKSPIGLIALKWPNWEWGNIIISKDVKRIYAYMYAEGSLYSGEKKVNTTVTPYVRSGIWNIPQNQLYIRGLIASKNTIWGAQQKIDGIVNPVCPALTPDCIATGSWANTQNYDWDYFRNYDKTDTSQLALPTERSSISRIRDAVMIVEYDPRILTDPPPWWREAK
jgi:hypothetical protein